MRNARLGPIIAFTLSIAGCGGGGDGGEYCSGTFEGGNTDFGCSACNGPDGLDSDAFAAVIDNNANTYRSFGFTGGGTINIRIYAPPGMTFPGGANAGALILFPSGVPVTASYSLYNGDTPVAATSGATIASGAPPSGAGSRTYYTVVPASEIDRIDLSVSASGTGGTPFRLHEVCGDH